jgi:hypothetical protein
MSDFDELPEVDLEEMEIDLDHVLEWLMRMVQKREARIRELEAERDKFRLVAENYRLGGRLPSKK